MRRFIFLSIIVMVLLPAVFCLMAPGAVGDADPDTRLFVVLETETPIFKLGKSDHLKVMAYHFQDPDAETDVRVTFSDNEGTIIHIANYTFIGKGLNRVDYPEFDLENKSAKTYLIRFEAVYFNGQRDEAIQDIEVEAPADPYNLKFVHDKFKGALMKFESEYEFDIEIWYNYGRYGYNSSKYHFEGGKTFYKLAEPPGLTSIDVYVTDRHGNINSEIGEVDGRPKSHHYARFSEDESRTWLDVIVVVFGITFLLTLGVVLTRFNMMSTVRNYYQKQKAAEEKPEVGKDE